jgi:hypothetical protein
MALLPARAVSGQNASLTPSQLDTAVASIAAQIRQVYLFADRAEAMAAHIETRAAAGDYRGMTATAFQAAVTADMLESSNDRHMSLRWDPEAYRAATGGAAMSGATTAGASGPTPEQIALAERRATDVNGGVAEVRWLPERVGYLRISAWHNLRFSRAPLVAALRTLSNAEAIIFDVRANGGGDAGMVAFLQGYFMEPGKPLLHFTNRSQGTSFARSVAPRVEGDRLPEGIPVWVLADGGSGSASEDFAYTIKHDGRGRVVGERTAGAGHMNTYRPVAPGFMLSISWAGPISPVTGGNWEGVGVIPDTEVPAPLALDAALAEVYERMGVESANDADRTRLEQRAMALREVVRHGEAADDRLAEFEGVYGNQRVTVVGKHLRIGRAGGPPRDYQRVGEDRFVAILADRELRFHREDGRIVAVEMINAGTSGGRMARVGAGG